MNAKALTVLSLTLIFGVVRADEINNASSRSEARLLAALPQLSWPRTNLEFIFEKREEISSALAAGASSDNEAFKLAKQMEAHFKSSAEIKSFTEGWKMAGQVHSDTVHFSKSGCSLSGMIGKLELLFDRLKLISLSFWVDNDRDSGGLNAILVRACGSRGVLSIKGKAASEFNWKISGTNQYDIILGRDSSDPEEIERGLTIFIKHPQR